MNEELIIEENVCFKIFMVIYSNFCTLFKMCSKYERIEVDCRTVKGEWKVKIYAYSTKMRDEKDQRDQTLDNAGLYIENETTSSPFLTQN